MTKIYVEGDTIPNFCFHCDSDIDMIFKKGNLKVGETDIIVNDLILGYCSCCEQVLATPPQTLPQIGRAMKVQADQNNGRSKNTSIEVKISYDMVSGLLRTALKFNVTESRFYSEIIKQYIAEINDDTNRISRLNMYLSNDSEEKKNQRLSMKVNDEFIEILESLKEKSGIKSTSDLVRCIINQIVDDESITTQNNRYWLLTSYVARMCKY